MSKRWQLPLGLALCAVGAFCGQGALCESTSERTTIRASAKGHSSELILCGGGEVFILDMVQQENGKPKKVWSWRAWDRPELPEHLKNGPGSGSTDDCKPIDAGSKILITSSGWGVALVGRETSRALFYAAVPEAHSPDILPGNRVAVAGSFAQFQASS